MIIMDLHILRRSLRIIVKLRDLLAMTPRNPERVEEAVVIVRSVEVAVTSSSSCRSSRSSSCSGSSRVNVAVK